MRLIAAYAFAFASVLALGSGTQVAMATQNESNTENSSQYITIESGDTLGKIADKHNSTVKRLFFANTIVKHPDVIYAGDELRIPNKDEELTPRQVPANSTTTHVSPSSQLAAPALPTAPVQATPVPQQQPRTQTTTAPVASGSVWDRLAQCESGGNWSINSGNGYYGGLQFMPSSWRAVGGTGLPSEASREEQITRAEQLRAIQGWGAWPACSAQLGLL